MRRSDDCTEAARNTHAHIPVPFGLFCVAAELIGALLDRIAALEATVEKAAPRGLEYQGVWVESESYKIGDVVTWGGSMWVARGVPIGRPGVDGIPVLAVKRGRDGRESK
jgi:hypothetical protein